MPITEKAEELIRLAATLEPDACRKVLIAALDMPEPAAAPLELVPDEVPAEEPRERGAIPKWIGTRKRRTCSNTGLQEYKYRGNGYVSAARSLRVGSFGSDGAVWLSYDEIEAVRKLIAERKAAREARKVGGGVK